MAEQCVRSGRRRTSAERRLAFTCCRVSIASGTSSFPVHAQRVGLGTGSGGKYQARRRRNRGHLSPLHFNPGFAYQQHVRDQLSERKFRRMKLHTYHTLTEDVVKVVEITGDLASAGKVQGRLQMADDENGVVDAPGPALNGILLDGDCGLTEILD